MWTIVYDEETGELSTGSDCPYGESDITITEAWDGERGDFFNTLTFNGEPYLEYDHYDWYTLQYGGTDADYDDYYYYEEDSEYYYEEDSEYYYYYSDEYDEEFEILRWADYEEATQNEYWTYVTDEFSADANTELDVDLPLERGIYVTIVGVDSDAVCYVSGEAIE